MMEEKKLAATVAAIEAYIEEERSKTAGSSAFPTCMISPWKMFRLQELMRRRISIQQRSR